MGRSDGGAGVCAAEEVLGVGYGQLIAIWEDCFECHGKIHRFAGRGGLLGWGERQTWKQRSREIAVDGGTAGMLLSGAGRGDAGDVAGAGAAAGA